MNTAPVTYRFPVKEAMPEPAPSAPAGWVVVPISQDSRSAWAKGRTKRSKPPFKAFFNGMAALMEFPGLFPRRK